MLASTVFDTYFAGQHRDPELDRQRAVRVRAGHGAMATYFSRVQDGRSATLFTGGLGWIDRDGNSRVSDTAPTGSGVNVADRAYSRP